MNELITTDEKKILKLIKAKSLESIDKKGIMRFAIKLDKLNPEVAKAVLEQIPNMLTSVSESLKDYKEIVMKTIDSDDEALRSQSEQTMRAIDICESMLETCTTIDEKYSILNSIHDFREQYDKAVTEHRKANIIKVLGVAAVAGAIIGGVIGNASNSDSEIDIEDD